MVPVHFIEVATKEGQVLIRFDEITCILVRPSETINGRQLVTIPTRAKTVATLHTLEEFWGKFTDGNGGVAIQRHKIDAPPVDFSKDPPAPVRTPKPRAATA